MTTPESRSNKTPSLIERLIWHAEAFEQSPDALAFSAKSADFREAADTIAALTAELARYRDARMPETPVVLWYPIPGGTEQMPVVSAEHYRRLEDFAAALQYDLSRAVATNTELATENEAMRKILARLQKACGGHSNLVDYDDELANDVRAAIAQGQLAYAIQRTQDEIDADRAMTAAVERQKVEERVRELERDAELFANFERIKGTVYWTTNDYKGVHTEGWTSWEMFGVEGPELFPTMREAMQDAMETAVVEAAYDAAKEPK